MDHVVAILLSKLSREDMLFFKHDAMHNYIAQQGKRDHQVAFNHQLATHDDHKKSSIDWVANVSVYPTGDQCLIGLDLIFRAM